MSFHFSSRCSVALLVVAAAACTNRSARMDTAVAGGALDTAGRPMTTDTGMAAPPATAATPGSPMGPPTAIVLMTTTVPRHGTILVDGSGRALYILNHAPKDTTSWRPVSGTSAPTTTDTAINSSALGTTTGANGAMQATYDGKPLYYYSADTTANAVSGEGKSEGGATGHLVHPSKKAK